MTRRAVSCRPLSLTLAISLALACEAPVDQDGGDESGDTAGDGDGDGDGDPTTGDGDGDPTTGDGDGDGDPTTGDGDGDGDPSTGDGDGDGVCDEGESHPPIGQLCVRGEWVDNQELLQADGPVRFQLFPEGCYSSDCTMPTTSSCEVVDDTTSDIVLSGTFCLAMMGECTLPDCNGGGWSECELVSVPAGDYTVTVGDLQLAFSVPSVLDGSNCVGDPFG